jgi:predicted nucleotidyltransferase
MNQFARSLEVLRDAGVDFVVIGGVAHAAHGGTYTTYDLDICYDRSPSNIARPAKALEPYHARLRGVTEQIPFRLDTEVITQGMNLMLTTDLGDLDLFGEVPGLGVHPQVLALTEVLELAGRRYHVLSVEGLIRAKRAAARPKDLLVLPELEALREVEWRMKRERNVEEGVSSANEDESRRNSS